MPEPIDGKYFYIHRAGGINICYDYISSLETVDPSMLTSRFADAEDWNVGWEKGGIGNAADEN